MVDRDVRRPRRIVRHAGRPRSAEVAAEVSRTSAAPTPAPAESLFTPKAPPAGPAGGPPAPVHNVTEGPFEDPFVPGFPGRRKAIMKAAETTGEAAQAPLSGDNSEAANRPETPMVDDESNAPGEDKTPLGEMRVAERPNGFPTAATLADQDAEAAELRAELERLRQVLNDGPPPLTPARKRTRKPLLGVLVVGGTLGVLVTAILVPWSNLDLPGAHHGSSVATADRTGSSHGTGSNGTTSNGTGSSAGSKVAAPVPAARPAPAGSAAPVITPARAPLSAMAASLPLTGPGVTAPGTIMLVQAGPGGSLTVLEQSVLGPRGMSEVQLALPSIAALTGDVSNLRPAVRNLRAAVNGTPVQLVANDEVSSWSIPSGAARARTVQLSYRLTGAVLRSVPSSSGRALGVVMPLLGETLREQGLPLVVRALGPQIAGATCPGAPSADELCGAQITGGWSATVPPAAVSPAVLLQLNLGRQ